jgi:GrpB-like predicted nucleotidyltransferase (UPF0157 family)
MGKTVKIEDYNPDWVSEFQQEKVRIMEVLKNSCLCIEHIGSTSVKGLGQNRFWTSWLAFNI